MKRLIPWLIIAGYVGLCGLSYGMGAVPVDHLTMDYPELELTPECEELLPGEEPSGEIPVCTIVDFLPEGYEWDCDTDTDCYQKCLKAAKEGHVSKQWCEER